MKEVIGYVAQQSGKAMATDVNGAVQVLEKHMPVYKGDVIMTEGDSTLKLVLENGNTIEIEGDRQITLDESVYKADTFVTDETAMSEEEIARLLESGDITELEAAAAGETAAGTSTLNVDPYLGHNENTGEAGADVVGTTHPTESHSGVIDSANNIILTFSGPSVITEGESGEYTLGVTGVTQSDVTVTFTYSGVAVDGEDYTGVGSVVIPAGESSVTFDIHTIDDNIAEGSEPFTITIDTVTLGGFDVVGISNMAITTSIVDEATPGPEDTVLVSIDGPAEVVESETTGEYTVSLSDTALEDVTVGFTYSGTAENGTDYTGVGSVVVAAGSSSTTFTIDTIDDNIYEGSEPYTVTITSVSGGGFEAIAPHPTDYFVTTAIVDEQEPGPEDTVLVSIDGPVDVVEGETTGEYTVSLDDTAITDVTVGFTYSGTAEDGTDYTGVGSVVIAAGSSSTTFDIATINDEIVEGDEPFTVTITSVSGGGFEAIGVDPAAYSTDTTILDNDFSTITIDDVSVNEDAGTAVFTVTLSNPNVNPVTVEYNTSDGSAKAGDDYTAVTGTLTFNPGDPLTQTIEVPISEDLIYEGSETFNVNLTNPTNAAVSDALGIGTIVDNDLQPAISIDDVSVNEADGTAVFTVSLSNPSAYPVSVDYDTSNGTAVAGLDYTAVAGTLTFNPGDTTMTISVPVSEDFIYEGSETFNVNLTNPTNATIFDALGIGTIVDNDTQPVITVDDVTVNEADGTAVFTVTLSGESASPVSVDFASSDGTAEAGADYTAVAGTLTFNPGDPLTQTIVVPINEDLTYEGAETFYIDLSNPTNATISDAQGLGTIVDNEEPPSVSITDYTVEEGGLATFTVTLSHESALETTVDYTTNDGTATEGLDYTGVSGTLTFAAGETSQTITVQTTPDGVFEWNESFTVDLSNPTNAVISDASGLGTIVDQMPSLAGNILFNEIGLEPDGTSYIEILSIVTNASDTTKHDMEELGLIIVGEDGQVIHIAEGFISSTVPAEGTLILKEDGTLMITNKHGDVKNISADEANWADNATIYIGGEWVPYDPAVHDFSFGDTTAAPILVNMLQSGVPIDYFVANDPVASTDTAYDGTGVYDGTWYSPEGATGDDFRSFDGSMTEDTVFERVFREGGDQPFEYEPGEIDSHTAMDWTTTDVSSLGALNPTQVDGASPDVDDGQSVIFGTEGDDTIEGMGGPDFLFGEGGDDTLYGGEHNDYLDGGAGDDALYGGAGNDGLVYDAADSVIDGGTGNDTLILNEPTTIDFSNLGTQSMTSIEQIDLSSGGHTLNNLSVDDVLSMSESSTLTILGDSSSSVNFSDSGDWVKGASVDGFDTYTNATATVYIDQDINDNLPPS